MSASGIKVGKEVTFEFPGCCRGGVLLISAPVVLKQARLIKLQSLASGGGRRAAEVRGKVSRGRCWRPGLRRGAQGG